MIPLLVLITAAQVPAAYRLPDVPHVRQKPDFCGEACVEMALRHFHQPGTQDDVFTWSKTPRSENRGAWTKELKLAVEHAGFDPGPVWISVPARGADERMSALLDEALSDLRAGYPSILCMHFSSDADAPEHFRLLVGYEDSGQTLLFEDPAKDTGPTRFTREELLRIWPLKYSASTYTLVRLRLEPKKPIARAEPYEQHVAEARAKYGKPLDDLTPVSSQPFVVWAESPRPDITTVQWTVRQLEAEYFARRPDRTYDIFLFDGADSYVRHAKQMFGEEPGTPYGYASSTHHALVMNIATGGGTLVHELVHPYLAANFTDPPTWLNEGLASLYEQSSERDGRIIGLTNWRLSGLQAALRRGPILPFAKLVATSDTTFRDGDEALHYAQARYLMLYLQEEGLLHDFVRRALDQQRQDPSAAQALIQTLGPRRWSTLDTTWRAWVMGLSFR
jgi:hypothetical protein